MTDEAASVLNHCQIIWNLSFKNILAPPRCQGEKTRIENRRCRAKFKNCDINRIISQNVVIVSWDRYRFPPLENSGCCTAFNWESKCMDTMRKCSLVTIILQILSLLKSWAHMKIIEIIKVNWIFRVTVSLLSNWQTCANAYYYLECIFQMKLHSISCSLLLLHCIWRACVPWGSLL